MGARALACKLLAHKEMLAAAMRAREGLSSMPSTRRNGYWEARRRARPLPAPTSRKTVFSMGWGLVRWSHKSNNPWRIEGATP